MKREQFMGIMIGTAITMLVFSIVKYLTKPLWILIIENDSMFKMGYMLLVSMLHIIISIPIIFGLYYLVFCVWRKNVNK